MQRVRPEFSMTVFLFAAVLAGLLAIPAAFGHDGPDYILTSGETIADAQQILEMDGYLDRGAYREGVRDDATRNALKAFQWDHRLPVTGFLDWETLAELTSHEQPVGDSDGDGVLDRYDRCPGTPKGARVDGDGCPKDTDGDGVFDGLDRCPDTPKGAKVDGEGCPKDTDGDGVFDGLDRCPDTPKGARVDGQGCPKDTDGDGVFDGLDRCPDTPKGDKVDANGCSVPKPVLIPTKGSLILEGVNFETDSATLTAGAKAVLDKVAKSLKEWPEARVEIGGHTDSTGSASHNLQLSTRRASSVRDYLIGKGIDGSRLKSKGYGETVSIADNATREGRARNRRVELKRLD